MICDLCVLINTFRFKIDSNVFKFLDSKTLSLFSKNNFITFGSLNKLTKVNEAVITLWSKILSSIPNSKLLLKSWELNNQKINEETLKKFKKCNFEKASECPLSG